MVGFVLEERDLTDILLNHSVGFDRELDAKIREFYDRIAQMIQRSLDLGIQMELVRKCDTRAVSYCILGGIKEVIGVLSRTRSQDTEMLVQEILDFGVRGVARAELLDAIDQESKASRESRGSKSSRTQALQRNQPNQKDGEPAFFVAPN